MCSFVLLEYHKHPAYKSGCQSTTFTVRKWAGPVDDVCPAIFRWTTPPCSAKVDVFLVGYFTAVALPMVSWRWITIMTTQY